MQKHLKITLCIIGISLLTACGSAANNENGSLSQQGPEQNNNAISETAGADIKMVLKESSALYSDSETVILNYSHKNSENGVENNIDAILQKTPDLSKYTINREENIENLPPESLNYFFSNNDGTGSVCSPLDDSWFLFIDAIHTNAFLMGNISHYLLDDLNQEKSRLTIEEENGEIIIKGNARTPEFLVLESYVLPEEDAEEFNWELIYKLDKNGYIPKEAEFKKDTEIIKVNYRNISGRSEGFNLPDSLFNFLNTPFVINN